MMTIHCCLLRSTGGEETLQRRQQRHRGLITRDCWREIGWNTFPSMPWFEKWYCETSVAENGEPFKVSLKTSRCVSNSADPIRPNCPQRVAKSRAELVVIWAWPKKMLIASCKWALCGELVVDDDCRWRFLSVSYRCRDGVEEEQQDVATARQQLVTTITSRRARWLLRRCRRQHPLQQCSRADHLQQRHNNQEPGMYHFLCRGETPPWRGDRGGCYAIAPRRNQPPPQINPSYSPAACVLQYLASTSKLLPANGSAAGMLHTVVYISLTKWHMWKPHRGWLL